MTSILDGRPCRNYTSYLLGSWESLMQRCLNCSNSKLPPRTEHPDMIWKSPKSIRPGLWSVWHTTSAWASPELWGSPECHPSGTCKAVEEGASGEKKVSGQTDSTKQPQHSLFLLGDFCARFSYGAQRPQWWECMLMRLIKTYYGVSLQRKIHTCAYVMALD